MQRIFSFSSSFRARHLGLVSVGSLFFSGFCGILSELALFRLTESLLGATHSSLALTMGLMMFAMGVGAAFTAGLTPQKDLAFSFVFLELSLGVLGAASVLGIYCIAAILPQYISFFAGGASFFLGLLIGMEIPLMLRLNARFGLGLKQNAALVLAPDYFGALLAFVLFGSFFLPRLGLGYTSWVGGGLNFLVGMGVFVFFFPVLEKKKLLLGAALVGLAVLFFLGVQMNPFLSWAQQKRFRHTIVHAEETPYQELVLTERKGEENPASKREKKLIPLAKEKALDLVLKPTAGLCEKDVRLYLNGALQFSTCDAHRYHEVLVHPAASLAPLETGVLVLGGGDGLALRELLLYPEIRQILLVELDKQVVELFSQDKRFSWVNAGAFDSSRVKIQIDDAQRFLSTTAQRFGLVIMDFPDPYSPQTARLYSVEFFQMVKKVLSPKGVLVTQSSSPLFHPKVFLSIRKSMEKAGFSVLSLHLPMLSFEHWGFQLGLTSPTEAKQARTDLWRFQPQTPTRYLNQAAMRQAMLWGKDMNWEASVPLNNLFHLELSELYRQGLRLDF